MLLACAIAVLSVLLGAAVGFSRRIGDRHLGPVRTFAFAAALAVVFGQFLPDAFEGIGIWAVAPFALGVVGPWFLERITMRASRSSRSLGLEIGYLGLLIHQLGDGIGMGTYTGPLHEGHRHIDLFLAIGGHTVPVAAMVVVAFLRAKGPRVALTRAFGLALFVVIGVGLARFLSVSLVEEHHAAISALVGGLLLHIATDDLRANLPRGSRDRALDFLAAFVGLIVVVAMSSGHEHEHATHAIVSPTHREALTIFGDLALKLAPLLLAALVAGSVLKAIAERAIGFDTEASRREWLRSGSVFTQAAKGLFASARIPLDQKSPAATLVALGASPPLIVTFVVVTGALSLDTLFVSGQLLGVEASALRIGAAVSAAVLGGMSLALLGGRSLRKLTRHGETSGEVKCDPQPVPVPVQAAARAAIALDDLTYRSLPQMLVGLFAASYVSASLDTSSLASLSTLGVDALVLALVLLSSSVSAVGATPLAAVLIAKGVPTSLVLFGLICGPAVNPRTLAWLKNNIGWRGVITPVIAVVGVAAVVAFAASGLLGASASLIPGVSALSAPEGGHGVLAYVALAALAVLALGGSYRRGVRGFFGSLLEPASVGADGDDAHGHHHVGHHDDAFHGLESSESETAEVPLSVHGH